MRNFLLGLSLLIVLASCKTTEKEMDLSSANEQLIQTYYQYFNKHDWQKMADMYIDSAAFKDPSLGAGIVKQTKVQIIQKYQGLNDLFANIKDSIVAVYPSGKQVIVEFVSTGTGADKSTFTLPICTIFTIDNGKISKDFTYYNNF
jgi:predicted SnoaL-like aldol condensation-catalyzing enzyme